MQRELILITGSYHTSPSRTLRKQASSLISIWSARFFRRVTVPQLSNLASPSRITYSDRSIKRTWTRTKNGYRGRVLISLSKQRKSKKWTNSINSMSNINSTATTWKDRWLCLIIDLTILLSAQIRSSLSRLISIFYSKFPIKHATCPWKASKFRIEQITFNLKQNTLITYILTICMTIRFWERMVPVRIFLSCYQNRHLSSIFQIKVTRSD